MAGSDAEFEADVFRQDIRAAMLMGLPSDPDSGDSLEPTFHFDTLKTHASADNHDRPWDWTSEPSGPTDRAPVQVLCSIEMREGETDETSVGTFEATELILGFFEDEWEAIDGWTWVEVGARRYRRSWELPPVNLHDVTYRQVRVEAYDL